MRFCISVGDTMAGTLNQGSAPTVWQRARNSGRPMAIESCSVVLSSNPERWRAKGTASILSIVLPNMLLFMYRRTPGCRLFILATTSSRNGLGFSAVAEGVKDTSSRYALAPPIEKLVITGPM